jgi:galactitol-specific phosphotransferase system IIB component
MKREVKSMPKEANLITLIKKLEKKYSNETADNMLAGMMIMLRAGKDYFWLKNEIKRVLEG